MRYEKKEPKKAEDLTPQEAKVLKRNLTKNAKEVKIKDFLLFGKEAINKKSRGREIKGGFNWRLNPKFDISTKK